MQKQIHINYGVFTSETELEPMDRDLLHTAREAASGAYAPISGFKVGAAVLLENGVIVRGNNQENLAFPSGLCAERVAIFSASAQHPGVPIKAIAVTALSQSLKLDHPIAPCGACRQSIIEYEIRDHQAIRCLLQGRSGPVYIFESMSDLLPLQDNFLTD